MSDVKINRALNLVVPVETSDGTTVYIHSVPVPREVFEQHYLVISKTFAAIHQEGLAALSGPRVAALLLKDVAQRTRAVHPGARPGETAWDEPDGVERALLPEIRRLTNVIMPSAQGYQTLPFQTVIDRHLLSDEDLAEVEGVVTFFTVASAMHRRAVLPAFLTGMSSLWGAEVTSSNCTEYAASLRTRTETDSSGETAAS